MLFPTRARVPATGSRAPGSPTSRSWRWRRLVSQHARAPYAVAVSGRKPAAGRVAARAARAGARRCGRREAGRARCAPSLRFAGGSLAGALFVPLAAALALRHRLQERRAQ